jgi:dTDP-D-glucose 4,6-dehydratase
VCPVLEMNLSECSQGDIGEVYNIGTQKERTVLDVAKQIADIFKLPEVMIAHGLLRLMVNICLTRPLTRCLTHLAKQIKISFCTNGVCWLKCLLLSWLQSKIVNVKDRAFNDQRYFICDKKLAGMEFLGLVSA